jgi:hypothetical protein
VAFPSLMFVRMAHPELGSNRPPPGARPVNTAVNTAWTYLVAAGLFEIGWPLGLKWAQQAQDARGSVVGVVVAVVAMGVSGFLLYLAQKEVGGPLTVFPHGTFWVRRRAGRPGSVAI